VLEEGTSNYGSVTCTTTGVNPTAPTGRQFAAITSVGTGSVCEDFNTAVDPDIANGDYLLADDEVSPGGGVDASAGIAADCQITYDGDNTGEQTLLNTAVYDASAGDWHAEDIDAYFNPAPTECDDDTIYFVNFEDVAATDFDLNNLCFNTAGIIGYAVTSGTLPNGWTLWPGYWVVRPTRKTRQVPP
jgi:hypothetical protein